MRLIIGALILIFSSNLAYTAECTTEMESFNRHQLVIKGLLDLTLEGKMNKDVGDAVAARLKDGLKYQEEGNYNKACDVYDSILDDYGFDKSFGEAPAQEEIEATQDSSSGSVSSEASAATQAAPASADSEPTSSE